MTVLMKCPFWALISLFNFKTLDVVISHWKWVEIFTSSRFEGINVFYGSDVNKPPSVLCFR